MEAWAAFNRCDGNGGGGGRNPLGVAMFDTGGYNKLTRVAAAGKVQDPFRGWNTLVSNGIEIWNLCPELWHTATRATFSETKISMNFDDTSVKYTQLGLL
jgi:hypothetical protein